MSLTYAKLCRFLSKFLKSISWDSSFKSKFAFWTKWIKIVQIQIGVVAQANDDLCLCTLTLSSCPSSTSASFSLPVLASWRGILNSTSSLFRAVLWTTNLITKTKLKINGNGKNFYYINCTTRRMFHSLLGPFYNCYLLAVLGIRIKIRMFLGLPDPDSLVRGTEPDPDPYLFS